MISDLSTTRNSRRSSLRHERLCAISASAVCTGRPYRGRSGESRRACGLQISASTKHVVRTDQTRQARKLFPLNGCKLFVGSQQRLVKGPPRTQFGKALAQRCEPRVLPRRAITHKPAAPEPNQDHRQSSASREPFGRGDQHYIGERHLVCTSPENGRRDCSVARHRSLVI